MPTKNEIGYLNLIAKLHGQTETAAEIEAAARALPEPTPATATPAQQRMRWSPVVACACGRSHTLRRPNPDGSQPTRTHCPPAEYLGCGSDQLWTPTHGWVTVGYRPPNVTCECGHRFGVRPDQRLCTCHCGTRFHYTLAGWLPLEKMVTIADATPLMKEEPLRCVLA